MSAIVIPSEDYSSELEKALTEFREETISKMDELKEKFGLRHLEIAHAYRHRLWVWVNKEFVVNQTA